MRANLTLAAFLCLLCMAWPLAARADMAVIVHPGNPLQTMTAREVSDLYLGRARSLSPYELPAGSPLRELFFQSLNGMSIRQLNAYWARLRFSGEVLPPATLADSRAVVDAVSRNPNAIGYIDAAALRDSVKVVLRLKE
jgi:ABC-type phosphate transport system substrate-binding protein